MENRSPAPHTNMTHKPTPIQTLARLLLALALSLACIWSAWQAVRFGLGRVLAGYGLMTNELAPVDQALRLSPDDPDARVNRAALLSQRGEHQEAAAELERAAQLRPRDYYLWLELGMARDRMGDAARAELAFREAKRLAPHYAQPAWQLGNLLFRAGLEEEALGELVRAAKTDPTLLPAIIELTWAARPNATAVRELLKPQTSLEHLALARFFAKRGAGAEAVVEFRGAGTPNLEEAASLINQLIAQGAYRDAREAWVYAYLSGNANPEPPDVLIYDGGFERALTIDDPGFGWRVSQTLPNIKLSQDSANAREGGKSLRVDFRGITNPVAVVSQMILVEPKTHYRLQFASRTQELVSGGLPFIAVSEATPPRVQIAETPVLAGGTDQWRDSTLEFDTGPQTHAVLVQVLRKGCTPEPCPIFGSLWLDAFVLTKS